MHFAYFGDHGLVPGGVPDQLDFGFVHAGEGFDLGFGFLGEDGAHAATGGGEGHFDGDEGAVGVARGDLAIVDEAEVNDVHGNLGVVAGLELVPDAFFIDGGIGVPGLGRGLGGDGGFEAESAGILGADAGEAHLGGDGVAAAEGLGDEDGVAGVKEDGVAGGDLDGGAVAGEGALGVLVHTINRIFCGGRL